MSAGRFWFLLGWSTALLMIALTLALFAGCIHARGCPAQATNNPTSGGSGERSCPRGR